MGKAVATEYASTFGYLRWNDESLYVVSADDPKPPKGNGWVLHSTCVGELRKSKQPLVWTWSRGVPS